MKYNLRLIYFSILLFSFVLLVLITLVFLEKEVEKTQLGLALMYLIGALVFTHNIYAFYNKKVMRFRSLTFYYPQDNGIRGFIFCVSTIAVGGFGFAFISLLF